MTTSLAHLLDQQIAAERKDYKSSKFHVSSAGQCYRKRYWQRANKAQTNPPDERALRIFAVGNIIHEWIQSKLEAMGILIAKEQPVKDEYRSGRIDAITLQDGQYIIYDFKTVHSRKFWYLVKKQETDPQYGHQVVTYYDMLEWQYKPVQLRILYISKDDLALEEVVIRPQDWLQSVREDWDKMIGYWEKEKLPPGEPNFEWECRYCNFRDLCKETK